MITKDFVDEFRRFADNEVHPVVSPDNWHIYSQLIDFIDELEDSAKEQEAVPVDTKMIGMPNGTDIEAFCCPDCRIVLDESFHFCPNCGQAVKWDD